MVELPANVPSGKNENNRHENSQLLYSNPTYNVRDFTSREDDIELLHKSYGDDSTNEICEFKLDQGKIDELANDYCAETCISSSRESAIQNEPYEEPVKSDDIPPRNKDKSRCKSTRKRKTRRKTPDGVIIDFSKNVYGTSYNGVKISVISMHNLTPEAKFSQKRNSRFSTRNRGSRKRVMNKIIKSPVLAVFYAENCSEMKKAERSAKRKRKNYQRELVSHVVHPSVSMMNQFKNALNKQRESHVEDNLQSLYTSDEIVDSRCCHHALIDNIRYPVLDAEQTCVGDARKHIANFCCSIFNDKREEYRTSDQEDYNADGLDFNAETQADWTAACFHPEHRHVTGCRCFCDLSEYYTDINMQHNCCPAVREARLFKNSALPKQHQRRDTERSYELRANIAPEFATEVDEYSPDRARRGDEERSRSASANRKSCATSKTSALAVPDGSGADLRDSRTADASRREIDTRPERRERRMTTTTTTPAAGRADERSNKSDSPKAADTRDARARRDDRVVAAASSRADRSPGEKGGPARGVDSEWKPGSIETDARQLDYKWQRRIATVDAGMRASVNFKGERDSRYKSEEAIRVQLRESAEIRKRESLQMVEATSQTRDDNTNAGGKRRETRDYSLWTSLQMGKIWSQMQDACKNVVKLAATSVGRVVKDAPKSERSPRNPVEVTDAALVGSSSSCADEMCGEECRKNLIPLKSGTESRPRRECAIEDAGKYREHAEMPMWKSPRAMTLTRRDMRKHVRQNAEKGENEKSCVFCSEHERDRYRNVVELPPRNEMYDENVYPQSRLNGSSTYLEYSAYPGLRNRGGSDDNPDSARSTKNKQKSAQHTCDVEGARSVRHHRNLIPRKCSCSMNQITRVRCAEKNRSSQLVVVSYKPCVSTGCQTIQTDVPDVARSNPLDQANRSGQSEAHAITQRTRSREKMVAYENIGAKTGGNLMSGTAEITDVTVSSTEAEPAIHSSQNNPDVPIASTSMWGRWEPSVVSSEKSQGNRPTSGMPISTTTMKFWRRRPIFGSKKTVALVFKRRKSIGGRKLSTTTATARDSGMKITQIEPSTVQTAREGNKRRTYVNVRMQTPDAIVTRILSEFLVSGEKKKRVLMSITLQSESDDDVSDRKEAPSKEAETQTQTQTSNDVASVETDAFDYGRPPGAMATSRAVQCFVCDKQNCYEIKHSDDSITLEDALIAEYQETSQFNDYIAKRKTNMNDPQ